jgi:Uma2 family endonuclease
MKTAAPIPLTRRLWRLTRARYDQLVEKGAFGPGDHVELLDGLLVAREPQGSRHAVAVDLVRAALERAFGRAYYVRDDKPLALDDASEPEPDVCVVPGSPRDYLRTHPTGAALVVEVAASGLWIARGRKATMYARAGIADYWIVNLADRVLEVHRAPVHLGGGRRLWSYRTLQSVGSDDTVSPLAVPSARVAVADLLP